MRLLRIVPALLASVLAVPAAAGAAPAGVVVITVTTAAPAMREILAQYEAAHPDVHVAATYTSAQGLKAVVDSNSAVDVILCNEKTLATLADRTETQTPVYRYHEAVLVPRSGAKIHALRDLAAPGMRLAGPTPDAPPYAFMSDVLRKASAEYGADFARRVEANIVIRKPAAAGIAEAIADGLVDGGIGFSSDASDRLQAIAISPAFDVVTESRVAVAKSAANPAAARAFAAYLTGPEARAVLRKHHFDLP